MAVNILALDIETAPILAYTWGLWDQNIAINQIKEHPRIICFTAKWIGRKGKVIFKSEYHHSRKEMLQALYDLLDEADIVTGWNSERFDIPWIEGELQVEGIPRPSPFKSVDLMKTFRKHSRMPSNKLDYASQRLLGESKVTHTGFQMWRDCIEPDVDPKVKAKAWALMKKYAIHDTELLEPLWNALSPYIKVPYLDDVPAGVCPFPHCGSLDIQKRGYRRTQASVFQRLVCSNGHWFSHRLRLDTNSDYRTIP